MLGVYDSGVGGLTVVKELRRVMPTAGIVYVGDTARAPYGGKDAATLFSHGCEIIRFLLKEGATTIVVACGTSSSISIDALRREFPGLPLVDTIRPAVKATVEAANEASKKHKDFRPVLIATEGTIKSGVFARLYAEHQTASSLEVRACPLFAPMVEAGIANHIFANFAATHYLSDLRGKVNALILGCTHYPLLTQALTHALGDITFINPATATAQNAAQKPHNPGPITYYATGDPQSFAEIAKNILNNEISAQHASL